MAETDKLFAGSIPELYDRFLVRFVVPHHLRLELVESLVAGHAEADLHEVGGERPGREDGGGGEGREESKHGVPHRDAHLA